MIVDDRSTIAVFLFIKKRRKRYGTEYSLTIDPEVIDKLNALKKKQKAINKQRSQFKRMIIENQDFVRQVLEENDSQERHLVVQRAQA